MFTCIRNSIIILFLLFGITEEGKAQEQIQTEKQAGSYYITLRKIIRTIYYLPNHREMERINYYWGGEIEREFGKGIRLGLALATDRQTPVFPVYYNVDITNYYQKSTSIGIGGKIYNEEALTRIKIQMGLYAYLNWLDYREVGQVTHYYGSYLIPINIERKAIPSIAAQVGFLYQIGKRKRFEIEYVMQTSINQTIENTRRNFYSLASVGSVNQNGIGVQLNLNLKYAIFKP